MALANRSLSSDLSQMVALARTAREMGQNVIHCPTGKRGVRLTNWQWEQIRRGEASFADFDRRTKKGKEMAEKETEHVSSV